MKREVDVKDIFLRHKHEKFVVEGDGQRAETYYVIGYLQHEPSKGKQEDDELLVFCSPSLGLSSYEGIGGPYSTNDESNDSDVVEELEDMNCNEDGDYTFYSVSAKHIKNICPQFFKSILQQFRELEL
jgi:hypothetical protein